jgi:hypothetical protein
MFSLVGGRAGDELADNALRRTLNDGRAINRDKGVLRLQELFDAATKDRPVLLFDRGVIQTDVELFLAYPPDKGATT